MSNRNRIKLSSSQVYAIEYLQKNVKVFVTFNSHLHAATVKFLLKNNIAKSVGNGYISLSDKFKKGDIK